MPAEARTKDAAGAGSLRPLLHRADQPDLDGHGRQAPARSEPELPRLSTASRPAPKRTPRPAITTRRGELTLKEIAPPLLKDGDRRDGASLSTKEPLSTSFDAAGKPGTGSWKRPSYRGCFRWCGTRPGTPMHSWVITEPDPRMTYRRGVAALVERYLLRLCSAPSSSGIEPIEPRCDRDCLDVSSTPGALTAAYVHQTPDGCWSPRNDASVRARTPTSFPNPCVVDDRNDGACRGTDFKDVPGAAGSRVEDLIIERATAGLPGRHHGRRVRPAQAQLVGAQVGPWMSVGASVH